VADDAPVTATSDDEPLPDAAAGLPEDRPRGIGRRIVSGFVSFGLVALIFAFLIPKLASGTTPDEVFAYFTPSRVAIVLALGLVNLVTNWPPIVVSLPGLRVRQAAVTNLSSAALSNTVPEGGAVATGLNFAMFRSWGFGLDAITSSVVTTGVWTTFVRYGLGAIALCLTAREFGATALLLGLGAVAIVGFLIWIFERVLRSERFARGVGRWLQRVTARVLRLFRKPPPDMEAETAKFRLEVSDLVRDRWPSLTVTMAVSQLLTALVLGVSCRLVGLDSSIISPAQVFVAFACMALASLVCPTPGGLGVAEAALIALLGVGVPPEYDTQIVAAVLLFRLATWLLPIPLGAGAYLFWRYNHSWRRATPPVPTRLEHDRG
jgi:putative heme transporter